MKISRGPMGLVFAAILAFSATDVMAQRGGRPGGGGFGGPGGGFGGPGGGVSVVGLLRIDEVRKEIDLEPAQEEALKKIAEDQPRPERPDFDFRDRSDENRAKMEAWMEKMRKERAEAEKKTLEQLEEVLAPAQMERLQEIEVQNMGVAALMNERVAEELKLTDTQKAELKTKSDEAREEMGSKIREIFQSGDREKAREAMEESQKEVEKTLMAVLTPEQTKKLETLKGKPFEMPERRGFGGGGRGGPGGADRGGRGGDRGGRGGDRGGRGGDRGGRPAAEE
ncbi:hypothetical protein NHH03_04765 [Stieleria sp. TO1_6]|uniref:hypothetical protein n=1 Tax=Stieleria tagensis TaxID=2956795 RepID=UPI00209B4013|nr:hypothetical protein [Stieleria tagensis]MCO8121040.1 hypothetical protein [Stieleria tagensis]